MLHDWLKSVSESNGDVCKTFLKFCFMRWQGQMRTKLNFNFFLSRFGHHDLGNARGGRPPRTQAQQDFRPFQPPIQSPLEHLFTFRKEPRQHTKAWTKHQHYQQPLWWASIPKTPAQARYGTRPSASQVPHLYGHLVSYHWPPACVHWCRCSGTYSPDDRFAVDWNRRCALYHQGILLRSPHDRCTPKSSHRRRPRIQLGW